MSTKNLSIITDNNGTMTNDDWLNKIITETQNEYGPMTNPISLITFEEGGSPDEKIYLVLLSLYDESREWCIKTGRQVVYDYLKDMVKHEVIDPNTSFIIACDNEGDNNVKIDSKPITVFRFLKVMYEDRRVLDAEEDFYIEEYENVGIGDMTILEV